MERLMGTPTFKREFVGVAPTQHLGDELVEKTNGVVISVDNVTGLHTRAKKRRLDRWLDVVVRASGSGIVFSIIMLTLVVWAFLGIPFGTTLTWQALISDVQATLTYVFDSFLMRQQLNGYEEHITVAAELRSRVASNRRMVGRLSRERDKDELIRLYQSASQLDSDHFEKKLPAENIFERMATVIARIVGHIITVSLYWCCIIIWLGFGRSHQWGPTWELDINSATSALMVFVFAFLANIRERHAEHTRRCMDAIYHVDSALELKLRVLTGDRLENECVVIPRPKTNVAQRVIFYYADIVGTLVGVALLIAVLVVWICIGPALQFNSTWQLLIGTYAGLVGLVDGFVMRNVQARLKGFEEAEFRKIDEDDAAMFQTLGVPMPEPSRIDNASLTYRVSTTMGRICAHELMVLAGVLTTVGLVIGSSVMRWSTTGQLISNIPPSIIESFFMMILITGHNYGNARTGVNLRNIYHRRLKLISFADAVEAGQKSTMTAGEIPRELHLTG
jgi:low-affinity ferrous iron transport protein